MNNCEQLEPGDPARWEDVDFLEKWKASRRKNLEQAWLLRFPLLVGLPRVAEIPRGSVELSRTQIDRWENEQQWLGESFLARCKRLDGSRTKSPTVAEKVTRKRTYAVPNLIVMESDGTWILSLVAMRANPERIAKAKALILVGLAKKAQRELACGLLGSEIACRNGHAFRVGYECGHRFCVDCGGKSAARLFAKYVDRFRKVANRLVPCWPPHPGTRPKSVIAKIDFTLRNTGQMPDRERNRQLNSCIKKFCRAIERKFRISRHEYGLAYSDEIGGGNTNPHAHAVYAGPWLPNKKKELSQIWASITRDGSFIISIKLAHSLEAALNHATKYPAKFLRSSTPERLAALEKSFHRVRRFHVLGAFDKRLLLSEEKEAEKEKQTASGGRRCPNCGEALSEPKGWRPLTDLSRRGLRDVQEVRRELGRERVFAGSGGDPP